MMSENNQEQQLKIINSVFGGVPLKQLQPIKQKSLDRRLKSCLSKIKGLQRKRDMLLKEKAELKSISSLTLDLSIRMINRSLDETIKEIKNAEGERDEYESTLEKFNQIPFRDALLPFSRDGETREQRRHLHIYLHDRFEKLLDIPLCEIFQRELLLRTNNKDNDNNKDEKEESNSEEELVLTETITTDG